MVPFLSTFMLFCTLDRLIHRVQFESAVPHSSFLLVLSRITIPTTVLISSNVQNNMDLLNPFYLAKILRCMIDFHSSLKI